MTDTKLNAETHEGPVVALTRIVTAAAADIAYIRALMTEKTPF